ncbi:MAG: bestrophin family ion channel [Cyanobacteria bacterium P01_H01_bin.119]
MARHKRSQWFRVLFRVRESVLQAIALRVLVSTAFAGLITALHQLGVSVSLPILSSLVPSVVLGLLLVFRTNTAYQRFWEGRILWGTLVNTVRNLARQIWVTITEKSVADQRTKINTLKLLVAFAIATKLHLRSEPLNAEVAELISPAQWQKLQSMNHPPLEIAFWIADYLQDQHEEGNLNAYQLAAMMALLDAMVDVLGGCERILKTPIPLAYSIHLKQLLLIYCLALPFQMVSDLGWSTPLVAGLVSFTVFGIEEIGIEIENPFGADPNDLPLDDICRTMYRNIQDLITLAPSCCQWRSRTTFGSALSNGTNGQAYPQAASQQQQQSQSAYPQP